MFVVCNSEESGVCGFCDAKHSGFNPDFYPCLGLTELQILLHVGFLSDPPRGTLSVDKSRLEMHVHWIFHICVCIHILTLL